MTPNPYYEFIMETAKTDRLGAAKMMVVGLMQGDRESLKMGYSLGSALIATLKQIPLDTDEIGWLVEQVAVPRKGLVEYGPKS